MERSDSGAARTEMDRKTLNALVALAAETHEQMRRTSARAARHLRELVARLDARAP